MHENGALDSYKLAHTKELRDASLRARFDENVRELSCIVASLGLTLAELCGLRVDENIKKTAKCLLNSAV